MLGCTLYRNRVWQGYRYSVIYSRIHCLAAQVHCDVQLGYRQVSEFYSVQLQCDAKQGYSLKTKIYRYSLMYSIAVAQPQMLGCTGTMGCIMYIVWLVNISLLGCAGTL